MELIREAWEIFLIREGVGSFYIRLSVLRPEIRPRIRDINYAYRTLASSIDGSLQHSDDVECMIAVCKPLSDLLVRQKTRMADVAAIGEALVYAHQGVLESYWDDQKIRAWHIEWSAHYSKIADALTTSAERIRISW